MATETPKQKTGGLAYDVILKPASTDSPRPPSPPKEPLVSAEEIERKLKEAEERRINMSLQKIESLKEEERKRHNVRLSGEMKIEKKSEETKTKVEMDLQAAAERKQIFINSMRDRLKEHERRIEEVRCSNKKWVEELKEKITSKFTEKQEKRRAVITDLQEKIRDHEKHIEEVRSRYTESRKSLEEAVLEKMDRALKNKEEQIQKIVNGLKEHDRHVAEVLKKRQSGDCEAMETESPVSS